MITLCGLTLSNYYNKVKMVLLEKGVPFTEERVRTGSADEAVLQASPLGKVPFIRVDGQTLCESQVIADYLEARYPTPPLVPADPLAMYDQTLPFYLGRNVTLVAFTGEFAFGQRNDPQRWIPTIEGFATHWREITDGAAMMPRAVHLALQQRGLPMTIVFEDPRRVVVVKP